MRSKKAKKPSSLQSECKWRKEEEGTVSEMAETLKSCFDTEERERERESLSLAGSDHDK